MEHVGGNRALVNFDYASAINKSIIIPDGRRSANINISIFDDENPELDEVFDVELTHVELLDYSPVLPPQIGGVRKVVVTIVTNDDAHGLMVIKADNPDAGSHGSRVTVDEIDRLSVQLIIERLKGEIKCPKRSHFCSYLLPIPKRRSPSQNSQPLSITHCIYRDFCSN